MERLAARLVDGVLTVAASEHRTQLRNREAALERLVEILSAAIAPSPRRRRPTRASRGSVERRLADKKRRAKTKQLRRATDRTIREGAHDEGEMGVLHALYQPQRETNLRIRLDEYLRFGLHAGIFYVT